MVEPPAPEPEWEEIVEDVPGNGAEVDGPGPAGSTDQALGPGDEVSTPAAGGSRDAQTQLEFDRSGRLPASPMRQGQRPEAAGGRADALPGDVQRIGADLAAGMKGQIEEIAKVTEGNAVLLRGLVAGAADGKAVSGAAEQLAEGIRAHTADFDQWAKRERRRRAVWWRLALVFLAPAFFLLGVLSQVQFGFLAVEDPTGGWRDHIWERYGRAVVACVREAGSKDRDIACEFVVRKP